MANYIKVYTKKDLKNIDGIVYEYNKETEEYSRANGILKTNYPQYNTIQDETQYTDGVLNGVQKVYDASGSLWFENVWKDGVMIKSTHIA